MTEKDKPSVLRETDDEARRLARTLLRSARSFAPKNHTPEAHNADVVLDTRQIARWSGCLGNRLTVVPIDGAMHDVYLSAAPVRQIAFEETAAWLARESG